MRNRKAFGRLVALLATTAIAACGDHTVELWSEEVPIAVAVVPVDAGRVSLPLNEPAPPSCPESLTLDKVGGPDAGDPSGASCELRNAVCEYGTSPDPQCNRTYTCTDPAEPWRERAHAKCFAAMCPANVPTSALEGTKCALEGGDDNDEAICTLQDGTCACTTGRGASDHHERRWSCTKPILGCPIARPNVGQACGDEIICDYGSCTSKRGAAMKCASRVWEEMSFSCSL